MEIRTVKPYAFFFKSVKTKLDDLLSCIPITEACQKAAEENDLNIVSPPQWHYHNFVSSEKEFDLEIGFEVKQKTHGNGEFQIKETSEYLCAVIKYEGPFSDFQNVYEDLGKEVEQAGYKPLYSSREVYLQIDMENPNRNVTEIQLAIEKA